MNVIYLANTVVYGDLYSNQDERNRGKQEFNNVKILNWLFNITMEIIS